MIELDCAYMTMPPPDSDTLRDKVLTYIRRFGGVTDNDLYQAFPTRLQGTVRARRIELTRQGKVRPMPGIHIKGRTVWQSVD